MIDHKTVALLASLNKPAVAWLGNVSLPDLVRLRTENANETFRTELSKHLKALNETDPAGVNKTAAEVARAISSLVAQHSASVEKLWQEYKKKFALEGVVALTAGVCLSPWLSSLLGIMPGVAAVGGAGVGAAANAIKNFVGYQMDKRVFANSIMGILSSAKETG